MQVSIEITVQEKGRCLYYILSGQRGVLHTDIQGPEVWKEASPRAAGSPGPEQACSSEASVSHLYNKGLDRIPSSKGLFSSNGRTEERLRLLSWTLQRDRPGFKS